MEAYPKRDKFHAMKLTRLLLKSCAAQTIGRDACLLVTYIASTEDAARYQYPVRFWNSQLDAVLAFNSRKQLAEVRSKAVEAGWLHYQREHDRAVGEYWTLIPSEVQRFDDSPVEDSRSVYGSQTADSCSAYGSGNGDSCSAIGSQTENSCSAGGSQSGSQTGSPSYPVPDPIKDIPTNCVRGSVSDSDQAGKPPKAARKPRAPKPTPQRFDDFWKVYPRRKEKKAAVNQYAKAVAAVAAEQGIDWILAESHIIQAAGRYASECRASGTTFIKNPATWLNKGCWADEPEPVGSIAHSPIVAVELLPNLETARKSK